MKPYQLSDGYWNSLPEQERDLWLKVRPLPKSSYTVDYPLQSLEIVIEDWCIGCGQCAKNCPYGNINMHEVEALQPDPERPQRMRTVVYRKATTCDLCRDIVGPDGDVSCVYACPHNAAFRMSGDALFRLVSRR